MPASICDPVSSALRLSLAAEEPSGGGTLLDGRLYSSTKSVLLSNIEFEESGDYQSNVLDGLKSKYVVIRPKKPVLETKIIKKDGIAQVTDISKCTDDGLPRPKRTFYSVENVQLGWQGAWAAGSGMQNVGNTCYLNSTLQALFHVPAFANWLVSEAHHADKCNQHESCIICGMRATLLATQKSGGSPIKPWQVYSKLRIICRHLTPGRQEDAHEFLRYLVEAMEKHYLSRFVNSDKLDQYSKETTPMNQILGGYLRSTVRCLACHHLSTTYQHFQDLLLDIRKHSTLDEALDSFFSRERLEDLGYKCEACNKKVSATKQFFIERAPMVLCIALKRFSLAGGKLSKHVQFRKKISLHKYMHNKNTQQCLSYKLVSMVTHLGPSQNCGHYTAIGQAPNANYYQFDDSSVRPLPLSAVLGTNAYIMFFERDISDINMPAASTSSVVYGPQLPDNILNKDKSPLRLGFYRHDERKPALLNSSSTTTETLKSELKPIILNSSLIKSSPAHNSSLEPWVLKQNGEVEKVVNSPKILNGNSYKIEDDRKVSFIIKRPQSDEGKQKSKSDTDLRLVVTANQKPVEKAVSVCKLNKLPNKSPLEKLEEQMNSNTDVNQAHKNGVYGSKLVPYDSESESGDERGDKRDDKSRKESHVLKPTRGSSPSSSLVVTTKGSQCWTVSSENCAPLLSPSLNGVTNKRVKEKEENGRNTDENEKSPTTSVSTMSPLSDQSDGKTDTCGNSVPATTTSAPVHGPHDTNLLMRHETVRQLQTMSHRGYGAPVQTWAGTHSNMGRQVFEERRDERKRALDCVDDMDRGRIKRLRKFNPYNRFNNNRNGYNPFQEKQNKPLQQWSNVKYVKYRNDRRPHRNFNHNNKSYNNKYKRFNNNNNNNNNNNRYNNGHNYPRHH